ncbi:ADD domain-containing protein 1 isoform X3 [Haematobia irritans]|uniref:ADD domain-containing protein 1 isoform X3 n=1 Tax=Haematobia irritans TaxID=7368 RepID=UPI003F4FBC2D
MPVNRHCIVRGCKNEEGLTLFSFSYDNMDAWLQQLGMEGRIIKMSYEKVCQRHFSDESFVNYNKSKLKSDAVPTLFLDLEDDEPPAITYEFHPSISEEERRFYLKAYPTVDVVRDRKVHCTVCKTHIGTAPLTETGIKMHPILRVSHCLKCHDFYNSGEFSKGEDGSELYCRWCGQGGEVYCCSSCPYVFCKSCIVKNLSRGVVADIEQNENWNCFSCAPKILWPLRAQHWALMNYIEQQKKEVYAMNVSEAEMNQLLRRDRSKCCRLSKTKCGNMSDSMESLDSVLSKRSHGSSGSGKKKHATPSPQPPSAKRAKTNDEVVCTPDLLSMLEPDCQITVAQKNQQRPMPSPSTSISRMQSQSSYGGAGSGMNQTSTPKTSAPPPLIMRNTGIKVRPTTQPPIVRRTVIGPRAPAPGGNGTPVYHTINGFRIDLNSAAQQETFRLPNGKLIQVKRQGPPPGGPGPSPSPQVHLTQSPGNWPQISAQQPQRVVPQTIASRPVQITQHPYPGPNIPGQPQVVRYHNSSMIGNTTINAISHNGTPLQAINGQIPTPSPVTIQQAVPPLAPGAPIRPVMVRHVFPETPIGQARTQLQEQVFNAMEICTHLTNKVQTLTNSNAYKQAKNYLEVKELYIHLSYLLTYAIGRFKGLQDKCLADMRNLGFVNDADCLENGQLAAAIDYVCYGQLDDVDLFNTGSNSFHNQVYEYRKSLHANLKDGEDGAKSPLPPLFPLGQGRSNEEIEDEDNGEDSMQEAPRIGGVKSHWMGAEGDESSNPGYTLENEENEEPDESFFDNDDDDDGYNRNMGGYDSYAQGTEESMRRNEESHAYDRKLTRLVSQYPSIWCTRHPDYGNFEVTRRQWRIIGAHFDRHENIKLRWKNIRKRFVRIEKRIADGKRFNGHFDKAMAFLANRDLPLDQWVPVDCGEDDGDTFDRHHLDAIEKSLQRQGNYEFSEKQGERERNYQAAIKPIEIEPLDLKIITFVKTNPVLWRKSMDPEADKIDEQTRTTVWNQLQKSLRTISTDYVRDRWEHLYEMYKTFRLKTIKSEDDRSNLELKYSKYLAKLYFLYKIDEQELRNETNGLFEDCFELDDDEEEEQENEKTKTPSNDGDTTDKPSEDKDEAEGEESTEKETEVEGKEKATDTSAKQNIRLQDMEDDKEFLQNLVECVREFPAIWNTKHVDYNDIMVRDNYWQEISGRLADFKRDVKTIKLRWQLAKFSYYRYKRENGQISENSKMEQYCKNLPIEDMTFLD